MSDKDLSRSLSSNNSQVLVVGDQVFVAALFADGKPFVFTRHQMEFLLALQKMKSVEAAALAVGKDEPWAKSFLSCRKFKAYLSAKMLEFSVKNGMTVEWWYQFGKWLTEGKKVSYFGKCAYCSQVSCFNAYEAESFRQDDLSMQAECPACCKAVALVERVEPFKPSREQVEGWKELGSRLIPKIERVHHEFEKEEIVFEAQS